MKVKVLSRNPDDYIRDTKTEYHKLPRNYNRDIHPFEEQREYVRALNATKMERMFAKPLIGDLTGHKDGIACIAKHPTQLSTLVSGSFDSDICVWNLPTKTCTKRLEAHDGYVRGIVFVADGSKFISVGDDKAIKIWSSVSYGMDDSEDNNAPLNTILSKTVLTSISHHRQDPVFATCGEICQLWEETRNEPLKSLQWDSDTLHHVSFNLVENNLLAACTSARSIILYDRREGKPLRKVVMALRPNYLAWNPMEAFTFTVANEDYK